MREKKPSKRDVHPAIQSMLNGLSILIEAGAPECLIREAIREHLQHLAAQAEHEIGELIPHSLDRRPPPSVSLN
jgi:hypothetical protein